MLLHGDSTVHGLLQEGLEMWSDIKPFKNPRNKSFLANIGCANVDANDGVPKLDVVWGVLFRRKTTVFTKFFFQPRVYWILHEGMKHSLFF